MKKTVFILFAAALAFAGCNKSVEVGTGETVSASFQISTEMTTKATLDGDGQGVNVNRFIMEVWHVTGSGASQVSELYTRQVKHGTDVTAGTDISNPANTTFTVSLVKGQNYDLLFWADKGDDQGADVYYNTSDLHNVVLGAYTGNDDRRDAFSQCVTLINVTSDPSTSVQLERPFAQLNIITQDIDDIEANSGTVKVVPDEISVAFDAPTVFNVKTQEASASAPFTSNVKPYYLDPAVGSQAEHYTLSMDYILASKDQQDIKDVTLTAIKTSDVLNTQTFSNIPLQRNYRTNILGNLLTTTGVFTVETAPVWASPENNENK